MVMGKGESQEEITLGVIANDLPASAWLRQAGVKQSH